ncbi:MAG: hypothetical protein H6704_13615 [Myxococcales bacterium]|nr:hypothetical protein [Myxococcales bacterium]
MHRVDLRAGTVAGLRLGDGVIKAVGEGPWGPWAAGMSAPHLVRLTADGPVPFAGGRRLRRGLALPDGSLVGIDVHAGLFRWTAPGRPPERLGEGPFAHLAADGPGWLTLDRAGAVTRWRVDAPPERVTTEPGAQTLATGGPAGTRVALAGRGRVRWWDAEARGELPEPGGAPTLALALDATGARLAAGDALGGVFVFDLPSGALRATLPGHTERVVDLAFLPDGDLLSVSWDGSARLWAVGDAQ